MKKILFSLFIIQCFLTTLILAESIQYSFEIYLIKKDASDLQKIELSDNPILTAADIKEYDWNKHEITLTESGFKKLPHSKEVGVSGKLFIVVANGIKCYRGAFWTSFSSIGHSHPIINVALTNPQKDKIVIERAYPTASFAKGDDPRNDKRIYDVLYGLGKIKNKNKNSQQCNSVDVE